MQDWRRVEGKTWRVGSSVSIRESQLQWYWEEDLYALLYYEMINNRYPPSYYVNKCIEEDMLISPWTYLKRNIQLKTLFIIQRSSIVNFFNTSNLRLFYNSSWQAYKSLSRRSAYKIFNDNPDNFPQHTWNFQYWRHEIETLSLWENL